MAHADFHLYSFLFYSILDREILGIIILLKVHNSFRSSSIAFTQFSVRFALKHHSIMFPF